MAIRKIVTLGDETLRKECRKQEKFDLRLAILLKDMADTMYRAEGVGLAAPQVGVLRRVCVIDVGDGLVEMINPVITRREGEQTGREGCLSLPGVRPTRRYKSIKVEYQTLKLEKRIKTYTGYTAQIIQHEIDHCNGILI